MSSSQVTPEVSVVLCSYNQEEFLGQAIESVLSQSFDNFELIAIDNGSTDGSSGLIESYSDSRIRRLIFPDNTSISRRFNQGIDVAKGRFISFIYSDDYYLPNKLEIQCEAFQSLDKSYGVVYSPAMRYGQESDTMWRVPCVSSSGYVFEDLLLKYREGAIDMISPMIIREALIRNKFREEVFAEGEAILYRLARYYKFKYIDRPVAVQRDHHSNAGKALVRNIEMTMKVMDLLEAEPDFSSKELHALNSFRSIVLCASAWQAVRLGGDPKWARQCIRQASKLKRSSIFQIKIPVAIILSAMPSIVRNRINLIVERVKPSNDISILVADYGGGAGSYQGSCGKG